MKTFKEFIGLQEASDEYEVVEFAGMRNQKIVGKFKTEREAKKFIKDEYTKEDVEDFPVMIMRNGEYD